MENEPDAPVSASAQPLERLELAHVLFMDLVAFSTWPMEEQRRGLGELQSIVLNTPQVRAGERDHLLIRLPTGDGMALVFFGDPILCIECAFQISAELKKSRLKLRMGINTGPVYRVADINGEENVAGAGINMAQRIMDAGDAGHILVSKSAAEILLPLQDWSGNIHDLGEHAVKHGVKLQFYNLYTAELGNPALPSRFQAEIILAAKRRRRRLIAIAVAVALVAVLAVVAANRMMPSKRRRSVAVMGFRNITGRPENDWVSTGLSEGLRTQLASTGKLRTISGEESAEMWRDLGLTSLDSLGKSSLGKLRSRGADIVIVGSYTDLPGGRIALNVYIQDTAGGDTDSMAAEGTETEISVLIAQTGERLRTKMGLGTISAEKERQLALSQPSPDAAQFYSEGLAKLRAYEPMKARSSLDTAVTVDPAFPFAHAALAEALLVLGYDQKAEEQAKKAFELSSNLSFEDHTAIEGRYRGIAHDWPAAITAYQQLYKYSQSQKLDYGLKLAEAQRSAGKGQDGLITLAELRKLPKPEGADPRIDLEEAETDDALGDRKRALAVAATAAEAAQATGARLLQSRALIWSCVGHRRLGEMQKAEQACEQSKMIATESGDKLGQARAINNLASIASDQGNLDKAADLFEQALAVGREIGAKRDISGALNNIGNIFSAQGRLAEANERYQEALKIQKDIGFTAEIPNTLADIGDVLHQQGDLAGAQHILEQAIAAAKESGNESVEAESKANLGMVQADRGDLGGAEQNYRQALEIERKLGSKSDEAGILDSLGDLLVVRGDLAAAERTYRDALSIEEGLKEKGLAAVSKTGLASVLLEQGAAAQAESAVRPSIAEFHNEKDTPDETMARVILVRSLLAQKKLPEAQSEMNGAMALAANASQRNLRYGTLTTSACLRAALGGESNVTGAKAALGKIAVEADAAGMPYYALEARLEIGEIEVAEGKGARGRTELAAIQKEAAAKGFLLIATKASK
jgi:eukaryotic-like serine/threonine-protein kinase